LQDINTVLGFAGSNEVEDKDGYAGFWKDGDVLAVSLGGSRVNALVGAVTSSTLLLGDYLSVEDFGSTITSAMGVLGEGASSAGETRAAGSCAKLLDDLTIDSNSYKVPASTPTAGEYHVHMTVGDMVLMDLKVGVYILLRDANGTAGQVNLITAMIDDGSTATLYFSIPLTVPAVDMVSVCKQAEVLVLT
jgi:hypothetical protein